MTTSPRPGEPTPLWATHRAYGHPAEASGEADVRVAHHDSHARCDPHVRDRQTREAEIAAALSPHATLPRGAGDRPRPEPPDPVRTCHERDRDRIQHSREFRRLAHKTQVFVAPENDHLRTRLTHAIEVAQVAVGIAAPLGLNTTLVEAIALGHDCGHGPGGHASEDALAPYAPGGVHDHAVYGADTVLAHLNLTAETSDGIRQHSWKLAAPATPEGEVVSWADRIAYVCHDYDDALRAGVVTAADLPDDVARLVGRRQGEQIGAFVAAMHAGARASGRVAMIEPHASALSTYRAFNYDRIYLRPASKTQADRVVALLRGLADHYIAHPDQLPDDRHLPHGPPAPGSDAAAAAAVAHIVGMTDRYAFRAARELLDWPADQIPHPA